MVLVGFFRFLTDESDKNISEISFGNILVVVENAYRPLPAEQRVKLIALFN